VAAAIPDPAAAEQALTYTLTVTNHGPDSATGVTLTDDLPSGIGLGQIATSQGTCSGNDPVLCDLGELPIGAEGTVTIDVIPIVASTLANRITVNLNETDPDSANNSTVTATTVNVPLEPATLQAACGTVRCALRLVCNLSELLGEDCVQEVTLLVRARDARLSGEAQARTPKRIRFAAVVANVPPGQTQNVRLRLTKRGKQIAKEKTGKRLRGFLEIRNLAATSVTNTPVTIRLR